MAARDVKRSREYWSLLNAAADRQASGQPFDKTAALAFSDWLQEHNDPRHILLAHATAHHPVARVGVHSGVGGGFDVTPREHPTLGPAQHGDDIGAVITDPGHRDYRTGNTLAPPTTGNGFGPIASHEGEVRLLNHLRGARSAPVLWWRAKIPASQTSDGHKYLGGSAINGRTVDFTAPVTAETLHAYIAAMPKSAVRARWQAAANAMYGHPVSQATHVASEATERAGYPSDSNYDVWQGHAIRQAKNAGDAAIIGDKNTARRAHSSAAGYHDSLTKLLTERGRNEQAALHRKAAEAHRAAAESYSKQKLSRDPRRLSYEHKRLARPFSNVGSLHDAESQESHVHDTINNGIKRWATFVPTIHAPSPGVAAYKEGSAINHDRFRADARTLGQPQDFHDTTAVLAGSKPAALISSDWLDKHPLGQAVKSRLLAAGHIVSPAMNPFGGEQYAVGKPDNVNAIHAEYTKPFMRLRGLNHAVIGKNLGYPQEAVEDFARRMKNRLARVRYNSQASGVSEKLSDNHAARVSLAKRILRETGLRATVRSVLSHTDERGVRPGVAALVHSDTPDSLLHYATAWLGMLTGEKRMTAFKPGSGNDQLHIITTPRSQADTGEYLRRLGAQFSLDKIGTGTRALLVNPSIDTNAASSGLQGTRQVLPGTAKMLGSGDSAESRARYRDTISAAERAAGVTAGPTSPL